MRAIVLVVFVYAHLLQTSAAEKVWPGREWVEVAPEKLGIDEAKLIEARDYAASAGGSGIIVIQGNVVMRWGDQAKTYDIKSATKSFGSIALGLAIDDGKIEIDAPARKYHAALGVPPESNVESGWLKEITVRQLATHTAGFEKPGGFGRLLAQPGTKWIYSDGAPNWLAECLTLIYRRDLQELMFERVFAPIGITRDSLRWRKNSYRPQEIEGIARREFGAGIHANVDALARIGLLYLREGEWNGKQILSGDFVRASTGADKTIAGLPETDSEHGDASEHYGWLWWNNADGTLPNVPRDAYWAWGLYDSLIVVVPWLELVLVRGGENGKSLPRTKEAEHYDVLKPLFEPIVEAVAAGEKKREAGAPYPASEKFKGIEWAPASSIIRLARGSDNWPITWEKDGALFTAYGDGNGFVPFVKGKLSLGFARIMGNPPDVRGINIRSDAEQLGDGAKGIKASGMLMVDGTLYMLIRNATNSQLGWSNDKGKNWTFADWKFTNSFGCPTFLNFGSNYEGARDGFVYIYSPDSDSAYEAADRMVLARVSKGDLKRREAYRFFAGIVDGRPRWSEEFRERRAVFEFTANCYRGGITFNPVHDRYFWVQILPQSTDSRGPRFQGGFGVYESETPWGPWRTVYFTRDWDVGPGETASFPTKWMSSDGREMHLVFSGDDHFSAREATLVLKAK